MYAFFSPDNTKSPHFHVDDIVVNMQKSIPREIVLQILWLCSGATKDSLSLEAGLDSPLVVFTGIRELRCHLHLF